MPYVTSNQNSHNPQREKAQLITQLKYLLALAIRNPSYEKVNRAAYNAMYASASRVSSRVYILLFNYMTLYSVPSFPCIQ